MDQHLTTQAIGEIARGRVAEDSEIRHAASCKECASNIALKREESKFCELGPALRPSPDARV